MLEVRGDRIESLFELFKFVFAVENTIQKRSGNKELFNDKTGFLKS